MLEWGPCPRKAGPPGPRLSSPEERERNTVMAIRVGVNMLLFCLVPNSLSHTTLSIKWEVYFSKSLCRWSLLCRRYVSACICVSIVVHGYTTVYKLTCQWSLYYAKGLFCRWVRFLLRNDLVMNLNCILWWASGCGTLKSVGLHFHWHYSQILSDSECNICLGPIYGSNRFVLNRITW